MNLDSPITWDAAGRTLTAHLGAYAFPLASIYTGVDHAYRAPGWRTCTVYQWFDGEAFTVPCQSDEEARTLIACMLGLRGLQVPEWQPQSVTEPESEPESVPEIGT